MAASYEILAYFYLGIMAGITNNTNSEECYSKDTVIKSFEELGVVRVLCDSCERLGWTKPTPIQIKAIPLALKGKDVIGLAETGSGKTAAFAIPLIQNLLAAPQRLYGLILAPTRELAFQIKEQMEALGKAFQVTCSVVVGGMDIKQQEQELRKKPHFVIGTPGRILDHLRKLKDFNFNDLKYLVMDEADRILDMDFADDVNTILRAVPREKKVYLFSATMTSKVEKLRRVLLVDPEIVEVSSKYHTVDSLKQYMLFVPDKYKIVYLAYVMHEIGKDKSVMVFCMTRSSALLVSLTLRGLGFNALPLFGKMDQSKRLGVLNKFKSKEKSVLIATDVASRGLDIPHVDYVINYDCPLQTKEYVHRVGRTARAGKSGTAITLVDQYTPLFFVKIERDLHISIPVYDAKESDVMIFKESVLEAAAMAEKQKYDYNRRGALMKSRKFSGAGKKKVTKSKDSNPPRKKLKKK